MTELTANPQYQHKTQWLNSTDGYLVLDKNINGTIDNAEELFSNAKVAEPFRGMASLGNWDADGNGLINSTDPLYNQLYVWEDLNSDGQTQNAELTKLTTLGVSSLDYANGTFSQNGQTRQMSTLSLKAETLGRSYVQKPDGIRINTNAGQSTLRVTQVHDLNNLQPNAVYYENRSCLRPNLLGWRSETYLKTGETCSQRAFSLGENRLNVQKSTSLGSKGSHSLLFLGAGSYEINSTVKLDWITS